jgi:hypothetical protein
MSVPEYAIVYRNEHGGWTLSMIPVKHRLMQAIRTAQDFAEGAEDVAGVFCITTGQVVYRTDEVAV